MPEIPERLRRTQTALVGPDEHAFWRAIAQELNDQEDADRARLGLPAATDLERWQVGGSEN